MPFFMPVTNIDTGELYSGAYCGKYCLVRVCGKDPLTGSSPRHRGPERVPGQTFVLPKTVLGRLLWDNVAFQEGKNWNPNLSFSKDINFLIFAAANSFFGHFRILSFIPINCISGTYTQICMHAT